MPRGIAAVGLRASGSLYIVVHFHVWEVGDRGDKGTVVCNPAFFPSGIPLHLSRSAAKLFPADVEFVILDLAPLPMLNQDLITATGGFPPLVEDFRNQVSH